MHGDIMKKIVVMSDNHGDISSLNKIKEIENNADYYIHCGDSEANIEELHSFYAVKGNNDWFNPDLRDEMVLNVEGINIYICHGHKVGYLNRLQNLATIANHYHCQLTLFGHSHIPCDEMVDGVRIINPGSTSLPRGGSKPSYAVIEINNGQISVLLKKFLKDSSDKN